MSGDPVKDLFPSLSEDELQQARENLDLFLALSWEIFEDSCAVHSVSLDASPVPGQDSGERSIPQTN